MTSKKLSAVLPGGPKGGTFVAFDRATGKVVWKALEDRSSYASPQVASPGGVKQLVCFTGTRMVGVKYADKSATVLGDGAPIGNLFGLQPDGTGAYLLSDWGKGTLLRFKPGRKPETLAKPGAGLADFKLLPDQDLLIAPSAEDHRVRAYSLKALLKR